jgi:hypothetical protein
VLLKKLLFQPFIFALLVIKILADLKADYPGNPIVNSITVIAVCALIVFILSTIIGGLRGSQNAKSDEDELRKAAVQLKNELQIFRGFLLLGALIYLVYHYLDRIVLDVGSPSYESDLRQIMWIRVIFTAVVVGVYMSSATNWFLQNRDKIVSICLALATIGIALMLFIAGPKTQFYYHGLVQVIAFSAFAFRIPLRSLVGICCLTLALYLSVFGYQVKTDELSLDDSVVIAVFANNMVALFTFIILAVSATYARQWQSRID